MNILYCYSATACHLAATAAVKFSEKGFRRQRDGGRFRRLEARRISDRTIIFRTHDDHDDVQAHVRMILPARHIRFTRNAAGEPGHEFGRTG